MKTKQRYGVKWFPHDADATSDEKMVKMLIDWGMTGYGMFWRIIEQMRVSNDYCLSLKGKHPLKGLAHLLQTSDIEVKKFINECIKDYIDSSGLGLFSTDGEIFWSESLKTRMKRMDEILIMRRLLGSKGGRKRWQLEDKIEANALKSLANAMPSDSKSPENGGEAIATDFHSKMIPIKIKNKEEEEERIKKERIKKERIPYPLSPYSFECQLAYQTWSNQPSLHHHLRLLPIMQKQFDKCWKKYGKDQDGFNLILQGIKNYGMILADPSSYFKYKWTFQDFLCRENAMAMFGISEEECREKFKKRDLLKSSFIDGDEIVIENSNDFFAFQSYLSGIGLKTQSYWTSEKAGEKRVKMKGKEITKHWREFLKRGRK